MPPVSTGIHWLDVTLMIVGAIYAVLTALAGVLPKDSSVTHALARVAGDPRGVRPAPEVPAPAPEKKDPTDALL